MAERNRPHACLDEDCLSDSDHACCGGPSCDVCHQRPETGTDAVTPQMERFDVDPSNSTFSLFYMQPSDEGEWVRYADVASLLAERERLQDFIARRGYRRCDIPACNCNSFHGGNAEDRLREISEFLSDEAGAPSGTILEGVKWLAADRERLTRENESLKEQIGGPTHTSSAEIMAIKRAEKAERRAEALARENAELREQRDTLDWNKTIGAMRIGMPDYKARAEALATAIKEYTEASPTYRNYSGSDSIECAVCGFIVGSHGERGLSAHDEDCAWRKLRALLTEQD